MGQPAFPPPSPVPASNRLEVRIATVSGSVRVVSADVPAVVVDKGGRVLGTAGGVVEVRPDRPSSSLVVRCPPRCDLVVGTTSGSVDLQGTLGCVRVTSAAGSIRATDVAAADVRTMSGKVEIGSCQAACRAATKSGSITVATTGSADVSTVSGTVRIERVDGEVVAQVVSGRVTIGSRAGGPIRARSVSGRITVRLPAGVHPTVKARSRRAVEGDYVAGDDVLIEVGSVSGAVEVTARG